MAQITPKMVRFYNTCVFHLIRFGPLMSTVMSYYRPVMIMLLLLGHLGDSEDLFGKNGGQASAFLSNYITSNSEMKSGVELVATCLVYVPLIISCLKLLVVVLLVELFRKRLIQWLLEHNYVPVRLRPFLASSQIQSIALVYLGFVVFLIVMLLVNLAVFLWGLHVLLVTTELYALINTYLFYSVIGLLVLFALTV